LRPLDTVCLASSFVQIDENILLSRTFVNRNRPCPKHRSSHASSRQKCINTGANSPNPHSASFAFPHVSPIPSSSRGSERVMRLKPFPPHPPPASRIDSPDYTSPSQWPGYDAVDLCHLPVPKQMTSRSADWLHKSPPPTANFTKLALV
jgi:hypothetical protein